MAVASHAFEPLGGSVERLIRAAREGSREALGELLQSFRLLLLAEARALLPGTLASKAGESDLVQSTFLEAQRDFGAFRGQTEADVRGWLCQILRRNVQNMIRAYQTDKRNVQREVGLETGVSPEGVAANLLTEILSPSDLACSREEAELLRQALERLSDEDRKVIILRHCEDCPFEIVAQRMQLPSAGAARKRFARAIKRLQEQLDELHG